MSIQDQVKKVTDKAKPAENPSAFISSIFAGFVTILTSVSFNPTSGKITIPGADEFLKTTPGFVSLTALPIIKSINVSASDEPSDLLFSAVVNVNSIDSKFELFISPDKRFIENVTKFEKNVSNLEDETIEFVYNARNINDFYYYKAALTNKNGSVTTEKSGVKPIKLQYR